MKKLVKLLTLAGVVVIFSGFQASNRADNAACWGQASAVFAKMGDMGLHSSQQETPRLGLKNLARELYDMGVIADDSMEALGAFVSDQLGLSIESCQ